MEDEQWLVSSSSDGITHLYRLSTENIPYDIKNRYIIEREFVPQVVTFSPDGQWLVEGRTNGEIRVFGDITLPPIDFDGDSKGIQSVAISPDNQWIASGEDSGNIRLWRLQSEEWFNTGCQQTERNLTWEEWQEYLPSDLQYHCTCPTLPAHSSVPASEIATDAVCAPLP
jgi:WD40 repeat protein